MSRALVRFCARNNPKVGTARNMQIGCGGHVTNLVAQCVVSHSIYGFPIVPDLHSRNITATLGLAPSIAEKDLYEDTRKFSLVYNPDEDPVVMAETEEMAKDIKAGRLEKDIHNPDPSGSDLSDSGDEENEGLWVDEAPVLAVEEVPTEEVGMVQESADARPGTRNGKTGKKAKPEKVFTPVDKVKISF